MNESPASIHPTNVVLISLNLIFIPSDEELNLNLFSYTDHLDCESSGNLVFFRFKKPIKILFFPMKKSIRKEQS